MSPPTISIPSLSDADVASALDHAGMQLSHAKLATMRRQSNDAFCRHVVDRLLEAEQVSPSDLVGRLERFIARAQALIATLEIPDRLSTAAKREILKHSIPRAPKLRRALNLPADVSNGDVPAHAATAIVKLVEIFCEAATTSIAVSQRRSRRDAQKLAPGKARARRHSIDRPLLDLIANLNGIWAEAFEKLPGASHGGGGPYLAFAWSLLRVYAAKIPDELEALAPKIRRRLRLSPAAIHGRMRQTRVSALRAVADREIGRMAVKSNSKRN